MDFVFLATLVELVKLELVSTSARLSSLLLIAGGFKLLSFSLDLLAET